MVSSSPFEKYGAACAIIAALLLPFKLTLGYFGLIPLIILWLDHAVRCKKKLPEIFSDPAIRTFILFATTAMLTSLFGINPKGSFQHIGTLFFFPLAIVAFYEVSKNHLHSLMTALCAGQALSCATSILGKAYPGFTPSFAGPVTQSGQISLTLFAAIAYLMIPCDDDRQRKFHWQDFALAATMFISFTALGFTKAIGVARELSLLTAAILFIYCIKTSPGTSCTLNRKYIIRIILPLILAGLLVNLKRGPWAGIFVALGFYSFLHRPKLLLGLVAASILAVVAIDPIQSRIIYIHEHFFLSGGRNAIWEIGYELAMKYPLGIGFDNSSFLRMFSNEIPENLKHFHSNPLNVLAETGWAGLLFYCLTMYQFIVLGFRDRSSPLFRSTSALGCGLIAWQIAGLVEYNFGDSAVVSVAYLMMGILLFFKRDSDKASQVAE